jgi:pilus assembly protein CpaC
MRTQCRPQQPALQRAWGRSLLTLAVSALVAPAVMGQTAAPARAAVSAPVQAATPARTVTVPEKKAVPMLMRAALPALVPARVAPPPVVLLPAPAQGVVVAPCGRVDIAPVVQVTVGKSTVIKPPSPITRILLGNPENSRAATPKEPTEKTDRVSVAALVSELRRPGVAELDIVLLSPSEVYVLGKSIGSTNVVLLDQAGRCTAFDVVVGMDTAALQNVLGQLLPLEKDVRVSSAYDSIVLAGTVSDAIAVGRVMDLANAFVRVGQGSGASVVGTNPRIVNMLSTNAPQQVMLEVKVAEVSKALLDQFGINFARAYVPGDGSLVRFLSGVFGGAIGSLGQISSTNTGVPTSSVGTVIGGTVAGGNGNGVTSGSFSGGNVTVETTVQTVNGVDRVVPKYTTTYGTVPGRGVSNATLNMQRNDGMVKVLAEPNVMAISGQEGRFNAGGKIFIPVAQRAEGGGTSITLEEKEFGVSVRFRPTVLDGGRINLEMVTEVSELNREGVGISAPGVSGLAVLPSFTSRKTSTTVQLIDGQSFAVGGLVRNNSSANVKAFPVLGELPVFGALFRSTEFQSDKSELVFVITPRLVKPLPANYVLPTDNYREPSRTDLILHGRIEGRPDAPAPQGEGQSPASLGIPPTPATRAAPATGGFQVK